MVEIAGGQGITLRRDLWEQICADCMERSPVEACGLVGGRDSTVQVVYPAENELNSPTRYRLAAREQLDILLELESKDLELVAIYHSHPQGPPTPSATDVQEALYPEAYYLICTPLGGRWGMRCFTIIDDIVTEVPLKIIT